MARKRFTRDTRRKTFWLRSLDVTGPTVLAAGAAVFDQSIAGVTEPRTVVRTRGIIWVRSDQVGASEVQLGALGMSVVTDQAAAIGVTALPAPITDKDSDMFFVHQYFAGQFGFISGTGAAGLNWPGFAFDSKAMRKLSEDQTIAVVVENASAAFGLEYILQFAMLIKV